MTVVVNHETGEIQSTINYDVHPVAALFPFISGDAFIEFVEDIRVNGQREPVVLDANGRLLDGRNRARACQALGIDVKETRYSGDDAEAWIISHNIHRRHLTESQRAMVAAARANLGRGGERGNQYGSPLAAKPSIDGLAPVTTAEAAKSLNVSATSVERARVVRDHGTIELQREVESGDMTVNKAAEIIKAAEKNPIRVAEIHADLKAGKPVPKPAKKSPASPPRYGGNRKKHLAVIDSIATAASGLAIAADEITSFDSSVTHEEAARLADDLSSSIRSLNRLKALLNDHKERTP